MNVSYVSPAGSDSADGLTPDTARRTIVGGLAALPGPGRVVLDYGTVDTGGTVDLTRRVGVTVEGQGGAFVDSVAAPTVVRHTQAGTSPAFRLASSKGVTLREFRLVHTDPGFTGYLVDAGSSGGYPASAWLLDRLFVGSVGLRTAVGLCLDATVYGQVSRCVFEDLVVHIQGGLNPLSFCNSVAVRDCWFRGHTVRAIRNLVAGPWTVDNCVFEARYGGSAGAIANDPGYVTGPAAFQRAKPSGSSNSSAGSYPSGSVASATSRSPVRNTSRARSIALMPAASPS